MRISPQCCRQHLGWMFKTKWKIQSKKKIVDFGIPELLHERDVKIYDAKEIAKDKPIQEVVNIPEPYAPSPWSYEDSRHPNWKDKPLYIFSKNSRLIEGDKQALALTKTIPYEGFPQSLNNLTQEVSDSRIEEIVHQCILESMLWDATQERLPKKIDKLRPGLNLPREYGIKCYRKVNNLLRKLSNLCEKIAGKNNSVLSKMMITPAESKVFIEFGEHLVGFDTISNLLIYDNKPLPLHFDQNQIEETVNKELPNIYPLKPLIGIEKRNIYTQDEIFDYHSFNFEKTSDFPELNCDNRFVHTIFVTHDTIKTWTPAQKLARAIGYAFSFATAQARYLYGHNVKDLPSPIVLQSICLDQKAFGFITYQLNTLNINKSDGIKNQVMIDGLHNLYEECTENGITGYNHEVFLKILAMYLNSGQQ